MYGLPMSDEEFEIFRKHTGRSRRPVERSSEVWLVAGRRSRKSAMAALIGVYEAAFRDHSKYLAPGERAQIPIVAKNMEEANQIRAFAAGILTSHPLLSHLLEKEPTSLEIALTSRCDMKIRAATHMAGRSKNVPCFLGDEIAFYPKKESAHPDEEILAAVRGGMALVPNALTVGLSSPFAKEGVLWERYREHFGREGDVLVWQADSRDMHDTPQIKAWAMKFISDDPSKAKAEVKGEFRDDIAALVPEEVVRACVVEEGRTELAPVKGVQYVAFVDPSGGQSDSMTLGIAHYDQSRRKTVLDLLREFTSPFVFRAVVKEIAGILEAYRCTRVWGDKYGGDIPAQAFRDEGIAYHPSEYVRSDIYKGLLPLLNSFAVELLDNKALIAQLCGLKRRLHEGGRDSVDHPRDGHDDVANSGAGACIYAERFRRAAEEIPPEYQNTEDIVRDRMWQQAKADVNPGWTNPYARKGR
jgi:hypothetical protein